MARTGNTYCNVVDLLLGDIATSAALSPQKYVEDASDEIDSKIGFIYQTPISIDAPTPRPVVLLLKRICSHLASGRLIMAGTLSVEGDNLHAYGESLVAGAQLAITQIMSNQIRLDGVTLSGLDALPTTHIPLIANKDSESAVDAFYDRVANPSYNFVRPYSPYGF